MTAGIPRILAAAALVWAAASLSVQLALAWRGGRRDYSVRAGSPGRAVFYAFTAGMSPSRKESARLHPGKFAAGVVLHAGVAVALIELGVALVRPEAAPRWPAATAPLLFAAVAAGLYLFARRCFSPALRAMSAPDDYISALATAALLVAAALRNLGAMGAPAFLVVAAGVLFYLPFGKLRHVLFCPVSRFDYARRLGWRGVWPARRGAK